MNQQGGIATIVDNEVRTATVGPHEGLLGTPPVLFQSFTFPGEHRDTLEVVHRALGSNRDRCGRAVLGGENVTAHPPHVGTQGREGLNQNGGLHGHVQTSHDFGSRQHFGILVPLPNRHQPRHLLLGQTNLLATQF